MPRGRSTAAAIVFLGSLFTAHLAHSQAVSPVGIEFQVNSHTTQSQYSTAVALESNGDFVVVWESDYQDGAVTGIIARRFSSSGVALAGEFQVNAYTTYGQDLPSVASDGDGDFVVAWTSYGQDSSVNGVFARRFNSSGAAVADEFQVSTYTTGQQGSPSAGMDADGDFVIAWSSLGQDLSVSGLFARRFASNGTALGGELQVNAFTMNDQKLPSIAVDADGDFIVVWQSDGAQDGESGGVFARRFSSSGTTVAGEFQVSVFTTGYQQSPSVAMDADGDFVVAWSSDHTGGTGVFARRFSSTGAAAADEFLVNSVSTSAIPALAVATDSDGDFVVVWQSFDTTWDVFVRSFSSSGAPTSEELRVNTLTENSQVRAAVAASAGGRFVVAWESEKQDGSEYGIFAQRLATLAVLDIDGDGAFLPLTDGLLVLRYAFGFRSNVLVSGAVNLSGCTRCDAPAIEAYLGSID